MACSLRTLVNPQIHSTHGVCPFEASTNPGVAMSPTRRAHLPFFEHRILGSSPSTEAPDAAPGPWPRIVAWLREDLRPLFNHPTSVGFALLGCSRDNLGSAFTEPPPVCFLLGFTGVNSGRHFEVSIGHRLLVDVAEATPHQNPFKVFAP